MSKPPVGRPGPQWVSLVAAGLTAVLLGDLGYWVRQIGSAACLTVFSVVLIYACLNLIRHLWWWRG